MCTFFWCLPKLFWKILSDFHEGHLPKSPVAVESAVLHVSCSAACNQVFSITVQQNCFRKYFNSTDKERDTHYGNSFFKVCLDFGWENLPVLKMLNKPVHHQTEIWVRSLWYPFQSRAPLFWAFDLQLSRIQIFQEVRVGRAINLEILFCHQFIERKSCLFKKKKKEKKEKKRKETSTEIELVANLQGYQCPFVLCEKYLMLFQL